MKVCERLKQDFGIQVTFSLCLLELPACRLNVALHQSPDHLLPVGQLAFFMSLPIGLKCRFYLCQFFNANHNNKVCALLKHTYHRVYGRIFVPRITSAAAAELSEYSPGTELKIMNNDRGVKLRCLWWFISRPHLKM